jgi:predicted Fe-Mo cluster-binding NifX family protein
LDNNESEHEHGQCNPVMPLKEKGVAAVVVAGMGARALMNLHSMGIAVFHTSETTTVNNIISQLDLNKMQEMTMENSCHHHNCH